jgi:hypothetical protein
VAGPGRHQGLLDYLDEPEAKTVRPEDMLDFSLLRALEQSGWLAAHVRAN